MESLGEATLTQRAEQIARALGVFFVETRIPTIAVTREGRFVAANRAAVDQYGYSLSELVTMRIHDFIADSARRARVEADLDATVEGSGDLVLARRPHRRKDGSILWVVPTAAPIAVEGVVYIVSALKDVTALLEAEARVRELELRAQADRDRAELLWQAASEQLTDGAALFDEHLRVVRCNSALATLLRRPLTELVGRTCRELFGHCRWVEGLCPHAIALAEQRRVVYEIHGRMADRPLRIEIVPAPNSRPLWSTGLAALEFSTQ